MQVEGCVPVREGDQSPNKEERKKNRKIRKKESTQQKMRQR
jgi:hypothetical protein